MLTVGLPYLALRGGVLLAGKAWQSLVIHRGLQILLSFLAFLFCLGVWKFAPLWIGRMALQSAAETLAQGSEGRNVLDMDNELRRKAYRLGFRGAITPQDEVSVERTSIGDHTLCTISFEFHREVDLLGLWRMQVPVSGKVEELVEPGDEKARTAGEILGR